jgi:3-(3-hydroxy-phenyl)propionate hydroxylase/6-hydroxy-3-succinoylpyridine 3-monooxygenase
MISSPARSGNADDQFPRETCTGPDMTKDPQVIVVGAGTVGLVTALGLARAGVRVTVLEAASSPATTPRDMVYLWPVLDGLASLGVLADCTDAGMANQRWCFLALQTGERIDFDLSLLAGEAEHPFNLHLPQAGMTRVLTAHLARYPGARIQWGTSVAKVAQDSAGVSVVAAGPDGLQDHRADWIVGADGSRSVVRRQLGLAFAGITWPERFVATDLRFDFGSIGYAAATYQVDEANGAVVSQVDGSGGWRYIHSESRALPEDTIPQRVRSALRAVLPAGADPLIAGSFPYRIHQRSAERFRVGRAILVGDAAHLSNPVNSSGMTSGLFDSYALTEALAAVIHGERDTGILDLYSDVRRRNFWEYASPASSELKEFVFPSDGGSRLAAELQRHREIAADPDRHRDFLRAAAGCATPSLLPAARLP